MPTKRNTKNYALVEVIQPKNYYELVKAKLCHNVEEIILSYVFYDSKRQTHACKLNINNDMEYLAEHRLFISIHPPLSRMPNEVGILPRRTHPRLDPKLEIINHIEWVSYIWGTSMCDVCKKKFYNIQDRLTPYHTEALDQADFTDNWYWYGGVCEKCDDRYNIARLHEHEHEDVIVAFMNEICDGETQAERDEIAYNWIGVRQDGDSDEDW